MGTSTETVYRYDGSLLGLTGGGLVNASLINTGSGGLSATITDADGTLSQSDDGVATFSLDDGSVTDAPIDYIGSGSVGLVTLLGVTIGSRPVTAFEAGGEIYLIAPAGFPVLSGLLVSFNIDPNADYLLSNFVPCYLRGTLIAIPNGYRRIETLKPGDTVRDARGQSHVIRWVGARTIAPWRSRDAPVHIPDGYFGPGCPFVATHVSQQHRVVIDTPATGPDPVFVRARVLAEEEGLDLLDPVEPVTYHHLLLDTHVVLVANGLRSGSLLLGPGTREAFGPAAWNEICAIFPEARAPGFRWTPCLEEIGRGTLRKTRNQRKRAAAMLHGRDALRTRRRSASAGPEGEAVDIEGLLAYWQGRN